MLKITTVKTDRRCRLVLEGNLISPWVEELKREWNDARVSAGNMPLIVDIRNVLAISPEAENVLFEMICEGAGFVCGGVHNRHIVQQLLRKCEMRERGQAPERIISGSTNRKQK